MKVARCRTCGAEIIWTETEKGRRMPVDADPESIGTFRLEDRPGDSNGPLAIFIPEEDRRCAPDLHASHFATCAQAAQWRRP